QHAERAFVQLARLFGAERQELSHSTYGAKKELNSATSAVLLCALRGKERTAENAKTFRGGRREKLATGHGFATCYGTAELPLLPLCTQLDPEVTIRNSLQFSTGPSFLL